jgi:hypothetical protein
VIASALLRAGAGTEQSTALRATATTGLRAELGDKVQDYLGRRGITDLERAAVIGGHTVDLLFTVNGANTAVLIDLGPAQGQEPARHLRLTHARGDLLTGLPCGGSGAKPGSVERTLRVPAWRILEGDAALDSLFV